MHNPQQQPHSQSFQYTAFAGFFGEWKTRKNKKIVNQGEQQRKNTQPKTVPKKAEPKKKNV